jgi:hypothetical protein
VKKFVVLATATGAATAAVSAALLGTAPSNADNSTANVIGEPYAKAVAILKGLGYQTSFGGSIGSDLPQNQCAVSQEKQLTSGKIQLLLDCTKPKGQSSDEVPATGAPGAPDAGGRPTPGAPGVVTVIPTQVG